jgi:hypothetical protein
MQPRERQLHLRQYADGARQLAASRPFAEVVKQDALAHARLPAHHENPAPAIPHGRDDPVEFSAFGQPVLQRLRPPARPTPLASHADSCLPRAVSYGRQNS